MKHFLLVFLSTIALGNLYAQKVTVTGTIATEKKDDILVVLNDTIRKLNRQDSPNRQSIFDNKKCVVETINGTFTIRAKKTDSLYFYSLKHITKAFLVADLLKQKYIHIKLSAKPCNEWVKCNDSLPELYVIAAKKIKLTDEENDNYCESMIALDSKFNAEYKIVQSLYGHYEKDTINFTVYDHNGRPAFEEFDNVLIYVAKYCDKLIHLKYQFSNIYKTADGRWAVPYNLYDYQKLPDNITITPEIIDFENPVEFETKDWAKEYIAKRFPEPYYKKEGAKMRAIYGNYIEDIFTLKKSTVLKSYGFFKDE